MKLQAKTFFWLGVPVSSLLISLHALVASGLKRFVGENRDNTRLTVAQLMRFRMD